VELKIDPLKHGRKVSGDIGIPEANDAVSFIFEPELPFAITACGIIIAVMRSHQPR